MVFFYFLFHHEHNFSSNLLKRIQLVLQIVQLGFSWKLELASTTQYTPPPGTLRASVTVEDWLVMLAFLSLRIRTMFNHQCTTLEPIENLFVFPSWTLSTCALDSVYSIYQEIHCSHFPTCLSLSDPTVIISWIHAPCRKWKCKIFICLKFSNQFEK